jgi:hypothetical protein
MNIILPQTVIDRLYPSKSKAETSPAKKKKQAYRKGKPENLIPYNIVSKAKQDSFVRKVNEGECDTVVYYSDREPEYDTLNKGYSYKTYPDHMNAIAIIRYCGYVWEAWWWSKTDKYLFGYTFAARDYKSVKEHNIIPEHACIKEIGGKLYYYERVFFTETRLRKALSDRKNKFYPPRSLDIPQVGHFHTSNRKTLISYSDGGGMFHKYSPVENVISRSTPAELLKETGADEEFISKANKKCIVRLIWEQINHATRMHEDMTHLELEPIRNINHRLNTLETNLRILFLHTEPQQLQTAHIENVAKRALNEAKAFSTYGTSNGWIKANVPASTFVSWMTTDPQLTIDVMGLLNTIERRSSFVVPKPKRWKLKAFHDHLVKLSIEATVKDEPLKTLIFPEEVTVVHKNKTYHIKQPATSVELACWAKVCRNCVSASHYIQDAKKGDVHIICITVDGEHITCAFHTRETQIRLSQARFAYNRMLSGAQSADMIEALDIALSKETA